MLRGCGADEQRQPASAVARHARVAGAAGGPRRPAADGTRDRSAGRRAPSARAGRTGRGGPGHRLDLPRRRPCARRNGTPRLDAVNEDEPRFLPMIGFVAVIVALVILVFFAIGYGFGRL